MKHTAKKLLKNTALLFCLTAALCTLTVSCTKKTSAVKQNSEIIASTSWTAAFCYLAGVDDVQPVAPASLRHPPEYELTVSDIQRIGSGKYFVYAGFERMMKTLGEALGESSEVQLVQIKCTNEYDTVYSQTKKLAELFGTTDKWEKRIALYTKTIEEGKKAVSKAGLSGAEVYCNANQVFLAKDLGFNVTDTFGPGPVTSGLIEKAKTNGYAFIIDNIHNPVGAPLEEVSQARYIIWRNFPDNTESDSLRRMMEQNIKAITE